MAYNAPFGGAHAAYHVELREPTVPVNYHAQPLHHPHLTPAVCTEPAGRPTSGRSYRASGKTQSAASKEHLHISTSTLAAAGIVACGMNYFEHALDVDSLSLDPYLYYDSWKRLGKGYSNR